MVVDYKTDRVADEAEAREHAERYAGQMAAYRAAVERVTGEPVARSVLSFRERRQQSRPAMQVPGDSRGPPSTSSESGRGGRLCPSPTSSTSAAKPTDEACDGVPGFGSRR